jgi:hypothetical protein
MYRSLGRFTFWALVVFMFATGGLVFRQREAGAAVSALITGIVRACQASPNGDNRPTTAKAERSKRKADELRAIEQCRDQSTSL